ncbi:hypothetical protein DLNHIDIE_03578 [Acidithiobacillus thiooxidans ATCC 19377]|uniref:Uncharacterized protein n=1 Tax=Acidithiobacillus thiooxidans ATCC 19377 TaxID=637390 RepID=A0A543PYE3_ACITH|nr:hypothetical protein DLNHIDIE_03578 [Acidithiobacillus thiooxidans ATCC 19377]
MNGPGKTGHMLQHLMHFRDNVHPPGAHDHTPGCPQSSMKCGLTLGMVDFFPGKHGVAARFQITTVRKIKE